MRSIALLACGLALAGCATVTRGTTEQIQFDSKPGGAEVRTVMLPVCDEECAARQSATQDVGTRTIQPGQRENGPSCVTPCVVAVARARVMLATFSKPGYEPQTVRVTPQVAGTGALGVAGNAIVGGAAGLVIDAASGAALDHCPNPVAVTLRRTGSRDPAVSPNLACKSETRADPSGPVAEARSAY